MNETETAIDGLTWEQLEKRTAFFDKMGMLLILVLSGACIYGLGCLLWSKQYGTLEVIFGLSFGLSFIYVAVFDPN